MMCKQRVAPTVDSCIDLVAHDMDGICAQFEHQKEPRSAWESFCNVMQPFPSLLWEQHVPPNQMGVNEGNRKGLGIHFTKCVSNAEVHCDEGYSYQKACEGAWAISTPPPPHDQRGKDFNTMLVATQPGLPPLERMIGESIGAGHQNGFLRAANAGSACYSKTLAPSGFLDKQYLNAKSDQLKLALTGLK